MHPCRGAEQFVRFEYARLAARAAEGPDPDLEIVGRAAERAHRQPLGIPAIRMAAGTFGTSKIIETFRGPNIGHFNRASKLVIGDGGLAGCMAVLAIYKMLEYPQQRSLIQLSSNTGTPPSCRGRSVLYSQGAFSGKSKSLCSLDRIGAGTRDPKHSPHPARDALARPSTTLAERAGQPCSASTVSRPLRKPQTLGDQRSELRAERVESGQRMV